MPLAPTDPQRLCMRGQALLMQTRYNQAIAKLVEAEALALAAQDWDTLSRLYMPLQEARRQRRQRCTEGTIRMDFIASGPGDRIHPRKVLADVPHGQVLVAGWGTIAPAVELRKMSDRKGLYLEAFLGAVFPTHQGNRVAVVPREVDPLPDPTQRPVDELEALLPQGTLLLQPGELPTDPGVGSDAAAATMALWERLHAPFLAGADATEDPAGRVAAYRTTLEVDYGCELAHQRLSATARELERARRTATAGRA